MLKRYWGITIATGLLTGLFILGLGWAVLTTGYHLGKIDGEYEANSDTYARSAAEDIKNLCFGGQAPDIQKCIYDIAEATNEHERAERDVVAQERMQLWALALLGVTAAGTLIALYGLILLRRTWTEAKAATKAAQEAVVVTREIGEAQVRAYLDVKLVNVARADTGIGWAFRVKIRNSGQSPARKILVTLDGSDTGSFDVIFPELGAGEKVTKNIRSIGMPTWESKPDEKATYPIKLTARYQDVFPESTLQLVERRDYLLNPLDPSCTTFKIIYRGDMLSLGKWAIEAREKAGEEDSD